MLFRKICYVGANRSDYAKIKYLLQQLKSDCNFHLDILLTGSLVNSKYGDGVNDLHRDGLNVNSTVLSTIDDDSLLSMVKSSALQLYEISSRISDLQPDLGIVVGDRFDALPVAYAFSMLNIPIAHIQGGEKTGTIDDTIRDVITKFSHIHFVANDKAGARVVEIGEDEQHVHVTGCPVIDYIKRLHIPADIDLDMLKPYLKTDVQFKKKDEYFLVMIHPNVVEPHDIDIHQIIDALDQFPNKKVMFYPNNDPFHQRIVQVTAHRDDYLKFKHLPMDCFLMFLVHCACFIGNSSAGIRESSLFGIPTVDIGKRQEGRERADNIINVPSKTEDIVNAIKQMMGKEFDPTSLYGDGMATERIVDVLRRYKSMTYKNIRL